MKALLTATLLCMLGTSVVQAQTDDFYETMLREGRDAIRANRMIEAEEDFRIASFGLLSRPLLLAESLVRLAVTQERMGRTTETEGTISRFLYMEARFPSYGLASLEPDARTAFETLLVRKVPRQTLASTPSLARLVSAGGAAAPTPTVPKRSEVPPPVPAPAPTSVPVPRGAMDRARDAVVRNDLSDTVRFATQALQEHPHEQEALSMRAHALTMLGRYDEARRDLAALPAAALQGELLADRFVALVQSGAPAADQRVAGSRVPEAYASRNDVVAARRKMGPDPSVRVVNGPPPAVSAVVSAPTVSEPVVRSEPIATPTVAVHETRPVHSTRPPPPDADPTPPPTGSYPEQAQAWAKRRFARPWSLQVELVCQEDSLRRAVRAGRDDVWFTPIAYQGRACYRVFFGHYDSKSAALAGVRAVPSEMREGNRITPINTSGGR